MNVPDLLSRLISGRLLRFLAPAAGVALVAVVLYNATSVDRVPPTFQIRLSAVAPNSSLALTLTSVNVVFNEQVDRRSAESAFSITPEVKGSFHWQGGTLIFTPSDKLPLSSTFVVHMAAGVRDLAGNAQGNAAQMAFTTVGRPRVVTIAPASHADAVPVGSPIKITFDRLMDPRPVLDGLRIEPAMAFIPSWSGYTLTLQPTQPLAYSTTYYIKIDYPARDTDGTLLPAYISTFTTVEMGLNVVGRVPAANVVGVSVLTQIAAFFDGPIDPSSIANSMTLSPVIRGSVSTLALPADRRPAPTASASLSPSPTAQTAAPDRVLVFTPDQPLAAHTTYTVTVSAGLRGTDGKAAAPQSWTFTTGEPATSALNQIAFLSDRSGVSNVWLMNPDGSNQRQVTAELTPVAAFDVSGDGATIAYETAGVVKVMGIGGSNERTMTTAGAFDYGATFTPDGTALVVGRRDQFGVDQGYWRLPLVSGADQKRVVLDGSPMPDDPSETQVELGGRTKSLVWASRSAFSSDGGFMLLVRGADNVVELVDMAGAAKNVVLPLIGNSRPIWDATDGAFYVIASSDAGLTWSCWRVSTTGVFTRMGPGAGGLAVSVTGSVAFIIQSTDGSMHVAFADAPDGVATMLTNDPTWSEASPSFAPDGSMVTFARYGARNSAVSGGIWIVKPDGTGLANLTTDGAYPRWLP